MHWSLIVALATCLASAEAPRKPPVIVDTDAGTDDLMAISYLLSGREVDLKAITVVNGLAHPEQGARNILGLLELAGRRDIPVFVGLKRPLAGNAEFPAEWRQLSDYPPGVHLPESSRAPEKQSAVEYLAGALHMPAGGPSVRILALGPLTNIAKALEVNPNRVKGIRSIVIMGGAISVPGNLGDGGAYKTDNNVAEWNIFIDPQAASKVFAADVPIELIPLDATNQVPIDSSFVSTYSRNAVTPLSRFVSGLFSSEWGLIEQHAFYAWDPLAAVILAHPGIAQFRDCHIEVALRPPAEGQTRVVPKAAPNARVAMYADPSSFVRLFSVAFRPDVGQR